jgi:hypothetical protein
MQRGQTSASLWQAFKNEIVAKTTIEQRENGIHKFL